MTISSWVSQHIYHISGVSYDSYVEKDKGVITDGITESRTESQINPGWAGNLRFLQEYYFIPSPTYDFAMAVIASRSR